MPSRDEDLDWLPDRHLAAALTLGHADSVAGQLCDLVFEYEVADPLELKSVYDERHCHVTVEKIAPLPPAIARLAADVLTQLRAAIEHAVYAEVEWRLGRELTAAEAGRIEMPAQTSPEGFATWLKGRKRKDLPPLRDGEVLIDRIRALQPYQQTDVDHHPLRLLAEHTNHAKHRSPAVAMMRLGMVNTWPLNNPNVKVASSGTPLEPGAILATSPKYGQVELSFWPVVAVQRPHTGEWGMLVQEIDVISNWARTVALPSIATGEVNPVPPLPPQIDTTKGWEDSRDALSAGGPHTAATRLGFRLQAKTARTSLPEILSSLAESPDLAVLERWVDGLTDDQVLAQMSAIAQDLPLGHTQAAREMIRNASEADERG
ncbi:hypothetical protein J2S40_000184 [Nocardioides luteus]|uniref:Uncharacterized protein n=1 Tax=Nocardioides luteus TaxID=1844 RepID=A0ABQ5SVM1_9ACTN|nr:hypothetical protein [Nocardioides luteus]MDR7309126.1 hypothetical protein [Nocardioides luteus]GGR49616.1 hypothetical protein GCM10010197_14450 [Nocardioides luteus]GLJ67532.1 hypothetical protein GCM10017579_15680 [Nocardioides luteus]